MKPCAFCNGAGSSLYPIGWGDSARAACRVCHGARITPGVEYTTAPILDSDADALVVPVNTVGVMGAGLAKAFARRYPDLASTYAIKCAQRTLQIGTLFFYHAPDGKVIVCLPTKRDWRDPSRIEYVETGVRLFAELYDAFEIASASFPQLGCGLGGLTWNQVKPRMEQHLADLPIRVRVHITKGDKANAQDLGDARHCSPARRVG